MPILYEPSRSGDFVGYTSNDGTEAGDIDWDNIERARLGLPPELNKAYNPYRGWWPGLGVNIPNVPTLLINERSLLMQKAWTHFGMVLPELPTPLDPALVAQLEPLSNLGENFRIQDQPNRPPPLVNHNPVAVEYAQRITRAIGESDRAVLPETNLLQGIYASTAGARSPIPVFDLNRLNNTQTAPPQPTTQQTGGLLQPQQPTAPTAPAPLPNQLLQQPETPDLTTTLSGADPLISNGSLSLLSPQQQIPTSPSLLGGDEFTLDRPGETFRDRIREPGTRSK